ncbi:MAG TPA: four helix bundle protein [Bacteroidetes bacterium]|nr:four helix bundle protein [Bacteroidota bacterium]
MSETKQNPLKEKSYAFALKIILITKQMNESKEFVLAKQLLRSGTAIGALVEEANQAESKADFVHKLSIANKEANETHYWLRLLMDTNTLDSNSAAKLIESCRELEKLLTTILKTTKSNLKKK